MFHSILTLRLKSRYYLILLLIFFLKIITISSSFLLIRSTTTKKTYVTLAATVLFLSLFITPIPYSLLIIAFSLTFILSKINISNKTLLHIFFLKNFIWWVLLTADIYSYLFTVIILAQKINFILKLFLYVFTSLLIIIFLKTKTIFMLLEILIFITFLIRLLISTKILFPLQKQINFNFPHTSCQRLSPLLNNPPLYNLIYESTFDSIIDIDSPYIVFPIFFKSSYNPNIRYEKEYNNLWNLLRWESALSKHSGTANFKSSSESKRRKLVRVHITIIPIYSELLWEQLKEANIPIKHNIAQSPFWSPYSILKNFYNWPPNLISQEHINEIEEEDCQCSLNRTSSLHLDGRHMPHCQTCIWW